MKRIFKSVILFVCVFMFMPAHAQPTQPPKLFLIGDNSAFIDINGQVVISAFDSKLLDEVIRSSPPMRVFSAKDQLVPSIRFNDFSEGRAVIGWALCPMCRNPFWVNGIINATGHLTIPPINSFTRYEDFHEGLAKYTDRGWGFIDPDGRVVISAKYYDVGDFSEERAYVRTSEKGLFGYLSRRGEMAIPQRFYWASNFHEGFAAVQIMKGYYGFIDNTGRVVFAHKNWVAVSDFSQGRAAIQVEVENNSVYRGFKEWKWGFIDEKGKFAIPPQFSSVGKFAQGRARFRSSDGHGFIDSDGNVLIKPQFADARDFSEGLAAVAVKAAAEQKLWGYINLQGEWAIRPQFKSVQSFRDGLAAVNCDEYGTRCQAYIDRQGKVIWQKS